MSDPTEFQNSRRYFCLGAAALATTYLSGCDGNEEVTMLQLGSSPVGQIPSLEGAKGWLNSPPVTTSDLAGKVVLISFWTYTCINWIRTLPYVRAWYEKYRDHGLVVIGVHTPEFDFEKDIENVRTAAKAMRVAYPIALDPDYLVWRAFSNRYWPAIYVYDAAGRIRHKKFGEGSYEDIERAIQGLLAEAGRTGVPRDLVSSSLGTGIELAAAWDTLHSGETYVGYVSATGFASPQRILADKPQEYTAPERLILNTWTPVGTWTIGPTSILLGSATGRLRFRFQARDLNLVLGPSETRSSVRFRVALDGGPPGPDRGVDCDDTGSGIVSQQRLYQLARQKEPTADRLFEIEFLDPGVEAYVFTFG